MTDGNGSTPAQDGPGRAEPAMSESIRGALRSESQRASGDAVGLVKRKREAWHRAWNLLVEPTALVRYELLCHDPLNAIDDQTRHRLCRVFADLVQSALEDSGWRMVPMTEDDHRAYLAASEELLTVLVWPDDAIALFSQPSMELRMDEPISLPRRIMRWFLGEP